MGGLSVFFRRLLSTLFMSWPLTGAGSVCSVSHMATNLAIDDGLLEEALQVGGHRTKKATVTEALEEYIQRRKQVKIVALFGQVDFDPKYDYKKARRRS